jgi:hypothetical protein
VSGAAVDAVEGGGVAPSQRWARREAGAQEGVSVVGHQCPGVEAGLRVEDEVAEAIEKDVAIAIGTEDAAAFDGVDDELMQCARAVEARAPWHGERDATCAGQYQVWCRVVQIAPTSVFCRRRLHGLVRPGQGRGSCTVTFPRTASEYPPIPRYVPSRSPDACVPPPNVMAFRRGPFLAVAWNGGFGLWAFHSDVLYSRPACAAR